MIIGLLIGLFTWFLGIMLALRPEWDITLPESLLHGVLAFRTFDAWIPAHEVVFCLGLYVTAFGALFIWKWILKLIDWVADIIP